MWAFLEAQKVHSQYAQLASCAITAWEETTRFTIKVLENTLKKLKIEDWNWNKITRMLYYVSV